jgi:RHS repeat-associated protein
VVCFLRRLSLGLALLCLVALCLGAAAVCAAGAELPVVSGGTVTTDGDYTVRTFTQSGTLSCSGTLAGAEVLVVGGGGGAAGGGGGAGGVLQLANVPLSGAMTVVVGSGGACRNERDAGRAGDGGGSELTGPDAVPTMTADAAPSGAASASSVSGSDYAAWKAFDKSDGALDDWSTAVTAAPWWLEYDFGAGNATVVTRYSLRTRNYSSSIEPPRTWQLQASNDDSSWTDLDAQTNVTDWANSADAVKSFSFANATAYRYYRLYVTAANGDGTWVCLGALSLSQGYVAAGGGGGGGDGGAGASEQTGGDGGSGGGAGAGWGAQYAGGAGTGGQGHHGASGGFGQTPLYPAGGGGGAGAAATTPTSPWQTRSVGGAGVTWHDVTYGTGGDGCLVQIDAANGASGTPNTGNGGDGGGYGFHGGSGGSGVVIVRYLTSEAADATVTVTSPNGGERLLCGSTQSVTWTVPETHPGSGHFEVAAVNSEGTPHAIATDVPATSATSYSCSWSVPESVSADWKVRVTYDAASGAEMSRDESDGSFVITSGATPIVGGGTVTVDGDYVVRTFTQTGTLTCSDVLGGAEVLVVGGGGSGSVGRTNTYLGAGGGAGEVLRLTGVDLSGSMAVVVGAGGASLPGSALDTPGNDGGQSSFAGQVASGGGGAPCLSGLGGACGDGVHGGGAPSSIFAGGGAGAGANGEDASGGSPAAAGGDGVAWHGGAYGGGGGAAGGSGAPGAGGAGGGGAGGDNSMGGTGGAAHTGAGGGAGAWTPGAQYASGAGGSGIVIVRYLAPTLGEDATLAVSAPSGGEHFVQGTEHDVAWSVSPAATFGYFRVSATDGETLTPLAEGTPAVDGQTSYSLSCPFDLPPGDYRVRVAWGATEFGPWLLSDESDALFSVASPPVVVTHPESGTVWADSNAHVSWDVTGAPTSGAFGVYLKPASGDELFLGRRSASGLSSYSLPLVVSPSDSVPTMTSNSAPSGEASASSTYAAGTEAWHAFADDGSASVCHSVANGLPFWLEYRFSNARAITKYAITTQNSTTTWAPRTWQLQGSNNGSDWVTLDARSDVTDWASSPSTTETFTFENEALYTRYRLHVTASNNAGTYCSVAELEMFEAQDIPLRTHAPNSVPAMTSNATPSGTASASSSFSSDYAAWKGFDHDAASALCWITASGTATGWLGYDFPAPTVVRQYRISTRDVPSVPTAVCPPKTWTFEGSDDGTNWTVLDTQTDVTDWAQSSSAVKTFAIANEAAYAHYRLNVSAANTSASYVYLCVGELELSEAQDSEISYTAHVRYGSGLGEWTSDDYGDAQFTIADPPPPQVTSPNGGECYVRGSAQSVTWTLPAAHPGGSFEVEALEGDGTAHVIADDVAVTSAISYSCDWTVPEAVSSGWKVRVIYKDAAGAEMARDASDGSFSIATATHVSGTISQDATWRLKDSPYVLDDELTVAAGATLTIQPGVVVKGNGERGISVGGALSAVGTSAQPIYFTSIRDDAVGGDANADGSATSPAAGDWRGLSFYSASGNTLDHVVARYAGRDARSSGVAVVTVWQSAALSVSHSLLADSSGGGVGTWLPGPLTIDDCSISDCGDTGISVDEPQQAAVITGNVISGNAGWGAFLRADGTSGLSQVALADNTITGNLHNAIGLSGQVPSDWHLPAYSPGDNVAYVVDGMVSVASGATLAMDAGVTVKAALSSSLEIGGILKANGTQARPVTFTSIYDDAVGGDTDAGGSATSPAAGDWYGFTFYSGGASILDHADVLYAGRRSNTRGMAIAVHDDARLTVADSRILHSDSAGIATTFDPALTVTGSTISDCASTGIALGDLYRTVDLDGNQISGNGGYAISAGCSNSSGVSLSHLQLSANTIASNHNNAVLLEGPVNDDWHLPAYPEADGVSYVIGNYTGVAAGATLTLDPGVVMKFSGTEFGIAGVLDADGTEERPITFTSLSDDNEGGDTAGDLSATSPAAGDWYGLTLFSNGANTLDHVNVLYAGERSNTRGMAVAVHDDARLTVNDSKILYSDSAGIATTFNPALTVTGSRIAHCASTAIAVGDIERPCVLDGNILSGNGGYAISVNASGFDHSLSALTLSGNTIAGNHNNAVYLSGCINSDWHLPAFPEADKVSYVVGAGVWYQRTLSVTQGATLTLDPGVVMKSYTGGAMCVSGGLVAHGTEDRPITFTSMNDDGAGGDSNGDGYASTPTAGDWDGLIVGGSADLDHIVVHWAGRGNNAAAIYLASGGSLQVHNSDLSCNRGYGVWAPPDVIDSAHAENNWWGAASGPYPYGAGAPIAYHIETDAFGHQYAVLDVSAQPWEGQTMWDGASLGGSGWCGYDADPVNVSTGNYTYQATDASVPAEGLPLELSRSYNSLVTKDSAFGRGWAGSYSMHVKDGQKLGGTDEYVAVTCGDGAELWYKQEAGGSFTAPPGVFETLSARSGGGYRLTTKDKTVYAFGAGGDLESISDRNGNLTTVSYDANGHLSAVSASGRALDVACNSDGHITSVTTPHGRTWLYGYDGDELSSVTDPAGGVTHYTYDSKHRLLALVDANGHTQVTNTYDEHTGRVASQADARGHATTFTYDLTSGTTWARSPLGKTTTYVSNARRCLLSMTTPRGATTYYSYDNDLNEISCTDPLGHVTHHTYDARGNVLTTLNADEKVATTTYNAFSEPLTKVDFAGHEWTYAYDDDGNLLQTSDPMDRVTESTYYADGQVKKSTDAVGRETSYEYNAHGDLTRTVLPSESGTTIDATAGYDADGRATTQTNPRGKTTTTAYDDEQRQVTVTDPLGHRVITTTDAVGNKASVNDARHHVTSYEYDACNNLKKLTDAAGGETTYSYDEKNRLVAMVDAENRKTAYAYDDDGNRTTITVDPGDSPHLNRTATRSYDLAGNLVSATDAKDQTTTYAYDVLGRLTTVTKPGDEVVSYTYDEVGNRLTSVDSRGTTAYEYNADGQLKKAEAPDGKIVRYDYYDDGKRHHLTYPGTPQRQALYAYDASGRLASVTGPAGDETTYTYYADGALHTTTLPNGITGTNVYDDAGRLQSLAYESEETLLAVSYARNRNGAPKTITDSLEGTSTYAYDALDQLTSETRGGVSTTYAYDAVGNRLTKQIDDDPATTYAYDAANELTSAGSTSYDYDANGSRVTKDDGGETTYDWNSDGLLTGTSSGALSTSYVYDGEDQRVAAIENGTETDFVLDATVGDEVVLQETTGDDTATYTYGAGLVSREAADGSIRYLLADALGSVRLETDEDGEVVREHSYDAFGTELGTQDLSGNRFRFTGQWSDPAGLVFLRARFYDPESGCFLSVDPKPSAGSPYVYCGNCPLLRVDPSGERHFSSDRAHCGGAGSTSDFVDFFFWGPINALGFLTGCPARQCQPFGDNVHANNALAAGFMFVDPFAGAGAALREAGIGAREAGQALRGAEAVDVAARRVSLRVGTKAAIRDAGRWGEGFRDPYAGVDIPAGEAFHYGHKPGFEWWRTQEMAREQGWTRAQLIEYENNPLHYYVADPYSNMSHANEMPR